MSSDIATKHAQAEEAINTALERGEITPQEAETKRRENVEYFHATIKEVHAPCHIAPNLEEKTWELAWGEEGRGFSAVESIYEVAMASKSYMFTEGA